MAELEIDDMDADDSIGGSEKIPCSDATTPKYITPTQLKSYIIDQIEAITAGTVVADDDKVYILDATDSALKPVDVDLVTQQGIDKMWGKTAETSPDDADVMLLRDGGTTEKTVTLANIADYILDTIESEILDVSDLDDGSGALSTSDYLLVTQGTTGKQVTVDDLNDLIYSSFKDYVDGLAEVTVSADEDVFYCIQGGTEKQVTLEEIHTYLGNPPTAPASTTENGVPQWSNATGGLKDGLGLQTELGDPGVDTNIVTEQGIREAIDTIVYDQEDIGEALADADELIIDDGGLGTAQKKSALSRVWTYITGKIQGLSAKTTPVGADILTIQDSEASNALKELTITNLASNLPSGTVDLTALDVDGGTDIGEDLADADLLIVDNGAGGTNRKSALSRVWTYILAKIAAVTNVSSWGFVIDEDTMTTDSEEKVPTQQSVKAYVDSAVAGVSETDPVVGAITGIVKADGGGNISAAVADTDYQDVLAEGAFVDGDKTKLDNIEAAADVTDATNVDAAGATMNTDTDVSGNSWVLDEDNMGSNSDEKVPTQQSVKAYVDNVAGTQNKLDGTADPDADNDVDEGYSPGSIWVNLTTDEAFICLDNTDGAAVWESMTESAAGWDGDITDADIDGAADIGADLADADLIIVDDGAGGTNRKSAISRVWTYIWSKICAAANKATAVGGDILLIQDSEDSNAAKELTLTNLKTFLDTATTYDEVWIPAAAMTPSETNGADVETKEYGTNDMTHDTLLFAGDTADESAEFDIVMPPSWDRSTVKFKAYWTNGHADANADEYVKFSLAAGARSNDDALDAVLGTAQDVTDQLIADDDLHVTAASAAITVGGTPALGDLVHFKITRDYDYDGGGGSAMDVDARLIGVLIQYGKDKEVSAW